MGIQQNQDQLNQWMTDQAEWTAIAEAQLLPSMLDGDLDAFQRWSDKLKRMSVRNWVLFVRFHLPESDVTIQMVAQDMLKKMQEVQ